MQDLLNLIRWTLLGLFRSKSSVIAPTVAMGRPKRRVLG
jgi:hypothetical protein